MDKNNIEVSSGMNLATSLNGFSNCMGSQPKTVLDGQKNQRWSLEVTPKTIGTVFFMLEFFSSCKVLKDWRYATWIKD